MPNLRLQPLQWLDGYLPLREVRRLLLLPLPRLEPGQPLPILLLGEAPHPRAHLSPLTQPVVIEDPTVQPSGAGLGLVRQLSTREVPLSQFTKRRRLPAASVPCSAQYVSRSDPVRPAR